MPDQPSIVARFFGYLMIGAGVLITLLSGGCTLFALYLNLTSNGLWMGIKQSLVFGLPFIAIGIGLYVGGHSLVRHRKPRDPPGNAF